MSEEAAAIIQVQEKRYLDKKVPAIHREERRTYLSYDLKREIKELIMDWM